MSHGPVFPSPRLLIEVVLFDIVGILNAYAFNFRSRINEWGEDDEQRWSYRRLLMIAAVVPTWVFTLVTVIVELQIRVLPRHIYTGLDQLLLVAAILCFFFMLIAVLWLPLMLYYKRPVGAVTRAPDDSWKFGLYYFNPQDGAWIVPARLGAGIALNYGQPLAWVLLVIFVTGFGVRWIAVPPSPSYEPADSVESQFVTATMQLRGGEFAASDRLLYMARHSDDPAVWSSVAYELTKNHVKPNSAREWAEKAVTQQELISSYIPLAMANEWNREQMSRLAAFWSNLGFVCLSQGDLDCAQRYLIAAWILNPVPAYRDELEVVLSAVPKQQDLKIPANLGIQNGVLVRQAVSVSVPGSKAGTAYFDVLLSEKGPAEIQWVVGDDALSGAANLITRASGFPWPDEGRNDGVQLREKLTCTGVQPSCELMVLSPEEAMIVPGQAVN